MAQQVREIMTSDPVTVSTKTPVIEAAKLMRDKNLGDVIVADDGRVCGLVTDRDLVVRALAEARDPRSTEVREVCSAELVTCRPEDEIDDAVQLMREHTLRRLPVMEDGHLVGTVSLGDLARERDPHSVLADISAATPNH